MLVHINYVFKTTCRGLAGLACISLALTAYSARAEVSSNGCQGALHPTDRAEVMLAGLGYSKEVIARLLTARADLSREIIVVSRENPSLGQAVIVYRGISVDPADFRPLVQEALTRPEARFLKNGVVWVSKMLPTAVNYLRLGVPGGPRYRTLLEMEIPQFLFTDESGNVRSDPFYTLGAISNDRIPDARPFIRRIGVVDTQTARIIQTRPYLENVDDIHWYDYSQVFINGKSPINPLPR